MYKEPGTQLKQGATWRRAASPPLSLIVLRRCSFHHKRRRITCKAHSLYHLQFAFGKPQSYTKSLTALHVRTLVLIECGNAVRNA